MYFAADLSTDPAAPIRGGLLMRRLTVWIYGLLTAAMLVFSALRLWTVKQQLTSAEKRLVQISETAAQLREENAEYVLKIGSTSLLENVEGSDGNTGSSDEIG